MGHDGACPDHGVLTDGHSAENDRPGAEACASTDGRSEQEPVSFGLARPTFRRRSRLIVVDEYDSVAHEDLVLECHAVADEAMALNLAASPDYRSTLDLDECADSGPIADPAPVQVGERIDVDFEAEVDVLDQSKRRVVRRRVSH